MKEIAIFDFDKTIFSGDSVVLFNKFLKEKNLIKDDVWVHAPPKTQYQKDLDSLKRKYTVIRNFQGFSRTQFISLCKEFAARNLEKYYQIVINEIKKLQDQKKIVICVSASFRILIKEMLSSKDIIFDYIIGSELEFSDDISTGELSNINASGMNKFYLLKDLFNSNKWSFQNVSDAYTDHISDACILLLARNKFIVKSKNTIDDWSHLLFINTIDID